MRILITGATGRIGRRLAARLIGRGDQVRTLVLPDDPQANTAVQMGVECIPGNLVDFHDALLAVDGVDAIVHLAAVMLGHLKPSQGRPTTWDVNVQGTYYLFEAAARVGCRPLRLVYASSDEVYPAVNPVYRPVDETHPRLPNSFYGMGKVLGEEMVRFYSRSEEGIDASIARFSLTQGAEELIDPGSAVAGQLFYVNGRLRALKGLGSTEPKIMATIETLEPLAAPDEPLLLPYDMDGNPFYQEAADARDIAQGLQCMLDRPEAVGEAFNLTPPTIVSMAEFIPYMAKATGRRYVEARLAIGTPQIQASGSKARALLGYNPQYTLFDMVDDAVGNKG